MYAEETTQPYIDQELLRREAGDGWHEGGMDPKLFAQIAVREYLIDLAIKEHRPLTKPSEQSDETQMSEPDNLLAKMYWRQLERVEDLKHQLGINDPPPRHP